MSRRGYVQAIGKDKNIGIKAYARFRPLIDPFQNDETDLYVYPNPSTVMVKKSLDNADSYTLDGVFPPTTSQEEIFNVVGKPIIEDILSGYNGTVFAYGQTGSGKSYTMMGLNIYDSDTKGIIPRATNLIFSKLQESNREIEYSLKCSIIEIYKESLRDLLSNSGAKLKIKEGPRKGVFVQGLKEVYVVCEEELMNVIALAESKRTVASTKLNQVSSRSHQLFVLEVDQKLPDDTEKRGVMNFIDLAGSEKVKESGVTGEKLEKNWKKLKK
ncbi:unnamed protein product [Blepharisma stoltei]|uniref:Kinesin-like protein n=1 Tax=Blepharisma stoltei TaxID=1481888 RepID=A0AAU9JMF6_9CILI|nr:unnamed protein product [Blepharisma stoltei]